MEPVMRSKLLATRHMLTFVIITLGVGCAAFSNPTTYPSVPVHRLREDVLGKSRDAQLDIPQALLRQPPNQEHIIDAGDTLGVFLTETKGGSQVALPPINFPQPGSLSQNIGIGIPVQVLDNGTITVPYLEPVVVRGLTIPAAQEKVIDELVKKGKYKSDQFQFSMSLYRARQYHVLVVRQDSGGVSVGASGLLNSRRGSGFVLDLPAYKNDVLTALTSSGGLPGTDAKNEVIIQRAKKAVTAETMPPDGLIPGIETIRIPLRLRPGEPIPFTPEDVILDDGDIVFVQSRDYEVFYVGGLITAREVQLPRDYDLGVVQAILQNFGPIANGGVSVNNQNGALLAPGIGSPSPSQVTVLRRCPGRRQIAIRVDLNRALQDPRENIFVQAGDVLILQETIGEAVTRYITQQARNTFIGTVFSGRKATDTVNVSSP
jgi:protein involved in polysaccharide export with SLBB domain